MKKPPREPGCTCRWSTIPGGWERHNNKECTTCNPEKTTSVPRVEGCKCVWKLEGGEWEQFVRKECPTCGDNAEGPPFLDNTEYEFLWWGPHAGGSKTRLVRIMREGMLSFTGTVGNSLDFMAEVSPQAEVLWSFSKDHFTQIRWGALQGFLNKLGAQIEYEKAGEAYDA